MIAEGRLRRRRRERRLLQLLSGIWLVGVSIALQVDKGETGRPFRTEDTGTVPLGSLEVELAADLVYEGPDRGLVFPLLSLKTGLADRVEVGVETG